MATPKITLGDMERYAIELVERYKIKTVEGKKPKDDEVWCYFDGYYHINGMNKLNVEILQHEIEKVELVNTENGLIPTPIRLKISTSNYAQIMDYIRARTRKYRLKDLKQRPYTCNIENGVLDYISNEVIFIPRFEDGVEKDFSDYNFTYKLSLIYDPTATCPEIDKLLEQILIDREIRIEEKSSLLENDGLDDERENILAELAVELSQELYEKQLDEAIRLGYIPAYDDEIRPDIDERHQKIQIFHEMLGHFLATSEYLIKNAIIYVGDNDTGKTTLENIARQFASNITSSIQLNDLDRGQNRFMSEQLRGKIANIADEMPSVSIKNFNIFMAATGSGVFQVEGKGEASIEIENTAKFVYTANDFPMLSDNIKHRIYSRLVIIECNNVFAKGSRKTKPRLKTKKFSDLELSGLLNHAIRGLNRLLKFGMFSYDSDYTPTLYEKHLNRTNLVDTFILRSGDYSITKDESDYIYVTKLHEAHQLWCKKHGYKFIPINFFSHELSQIPGIKIKERTDSEKSRELNKQVRYKAVIGIKKVTWGLS